VVTRHFFAAGERDGAKFASSAGIKLEIDFDRAPPEAPASRRELRFRRGAIRPSAPDASAEL
jgi:hypothetical protein